MISPKSFFFGWQNNFSPFISFSRTAMFAQWGSQKSFRKERSLSLATHLFCVELNKWSCVSTLSNALDGWWPAWMFITLYYRNHSTHRRWQKRSLNFADQFCFGECVIYHVYCFAKIFKACVLVILPPIGVKAEQVNELSLGTKTAWMLSLKTI